VNVDEAELAHVIECPRDREWIARRAGEARAGGVGEALHVIEGASVRLGALLSCANGSGPWSIGGRSNRGRRSWRRAAARRERERDE
jgi:hypothetical protein